MISRLERERKNIVRVCVCMREICEIKLPPSNFTLASVCSVFANWHGIEEDFTQSLNC